MNRDLVSLLQEIRSLLQEIYHSEDLARTALHNIGYPMPAIPAFRRAESFWPDVLATLDDRVEHGKVKLLKATAKNYKGSRAEADRLTDQLMEPSVEAEPERLARSLPGRQDPLASTPDAPPPPPSALLEADVRAGTAGCPTLTLEGANLAEQFLAVVREMLGIDAELLYVTRQQSSLRIPDPGDQDEVIRRKVQDEMRSREPSCLVTYRKFSFRPYLYVSLVVCGPDTTRYELSGVPATFTPEDIAAAIVAETHEANSGANGGLVRAVVDHESAETSRRLDPYATLHECGIRDGDRLRVAPEAIAGSLSPELRMEALLRAAAQIRGYAAQNPTEFAIVGYDDEELPGRVTVEITQRGLAPPAGLEGFPAGSDQEDLDDLAPVLVRTHRISIHFSAMFPLVAPEIVWETPVFHPNIRWAASQDVVRNGTLQFHPLLLGYRPDCNLAHIARVMTNVTMYRDYDLSEGPGSPNPAAAQWAGTDTGQTMIKAIGGRPRADVLREGDRGTRPPRLLWLTPLRGEPRGH